MDCMLANFFKQRHENYLPMTQRKSPVLVGGFSIRLHLVAPPYLLGISITPIATACSLSMLLAQSLAKNRYGQFLQRLLAKGIQP